MKNRRSLVVVFALVQIVAAGLLFGDVRRRAGMPPKAEPQLQFEGTITVASATSITVHDSHRVDVVLALTSTTVIRKGDLTLAAADLRVGDQVHVKATSANNVNTAVQVVVQIPEDQQEPELEIEGLITAVLDLDHRP